MGASLGQLANSVCRGSGGVIWLTKLVNDQTTYAGGIVILSGAKDLKSDAASQIEILRRLRGSG